MTRVLAIDPGGVTAGALYERGLETRRADLLIDVRPNAERFSTWAETDRWVALERCRTEAVRGLDALVVEDYRISGQRAGEANLTIEIIGALAWICEKRGVPLVRQAPGAGGRFSGKRWEKLRRIGWYVPGPDHERSAAGHLLLYLVERRLVSAQRVLECESMGGTT